jgi:hypothetical protein
MRIVTLMKQRSKEAKPDPSPFDARLQTFRMDGGQRVQQSRAGSLLLCGLVPHLLGAPHHSVDADLERLQLARLLRRFLPIRGWASFDRDHSACVEWQSFVMVCTVCFSCLRLPPRFAANFLGIV